MGVLQAGSFAALAVLPGMFGLVVGTVLFGITIGNLTVLIPLVVVELFGLTDYPRIYAVSQFGASIGTAGGPAALAALHSGFGSYRAPLLILAVVSSLAAAALTRLRPPSPSPSPPSPLPSPTPAPAAVLAAEPVPEPDPVPEAE
jgi:MFS family permease